MPLQTREQRRRRRTPTRHAAWIRAGRDAKPKPCVLWDRSEDGARIAVAHANKLPATFTLLLDKSVRRLCRVVWRSGPLIGVQFIESSEEDDDDDDGPTFVRKSAPPPGRPVPDVLALVAATRHQPPMKAAKRGGSSVSRIAGALLIAVIAQATLLYSARHESDQGAVWAANLCRQAGGLCHHPLIPFGASVLMAIVYLTIKGTEL